MLQIASIYTIFPFSLLIDVNNAIISFWHNTLGFSWGASIIGLTATIRLVILPLTFKQVRSMQAMQRLQPELKKLQERYKDDKKRQQEEMMKFYREHQVNPFGSCLPLVLQLPFFFSLYGLQQSAHFKHEVCPNGVHSACPGGQFLFIDNILLPATGAALVALLVLYVATQLGSSIVSATSIQDKNQRRLMFVFPFIFVPIVIRFQAGLLVYWITTNLWTVGQQLVIKRFFPPPAPVAAGAPGAAQPAPAAAVAGSSEGGTWGRIMTALQGQSASSDGSSTKPATKTKADARKAPPAQKASGKAGSSSSRNGSANGGGQKAPPPSPRKRKKRSGRRR